MKIKFLLPVLFVAMSGVATVSADDDTGFYLGLGLNRAAVKTGDVASSGTNGSFAAGYMFNDRMGVDLSTYVIGDTKDGNLTATVGTLALTGVYQIPVSGRFDVFGKLGVARTGLKVKQGSTTLLDATSNDLVWGVGGKMDFGKHNILLEYAKLSPEDGGVDIVNLGYRYEF
jgi:hypothetical protein